MLTDGSCRDDATARTHRERLGGAGEGGEGEGCDFSGRTHVDDPPSKIVERLRKETKATVIFATTTPILDDRVAKTRTKADYELLEESAERYNRIARQVMKELNLPVDDLRAMTPDAATREKLIGGDGIHFTAEGSAKLGAAVAEFATKHLPMRNPAKP